MNPYEAPKARLTSKSGQWPEVAHRNRWLLIPIAAVAAVPLAFVAIPYTFAARAAVFLGHWPYYSHPDPKDLPEHFGPPESLQFLVPGSIFVLQVVLIVLMVRSYARPERWLLSIVLIAVSLWLFSLVFLYADPAGVLDWILD